MQPLVALVLIIFQFMIILQVMTISQVIMIMMTMTVMSRNMITLILNIGFMRIPGKSQDDTKVIYKSKNACLDTPARTSVGIGWMSDFVDTKLAGENDITLIKQSLEEISILKDKIVGIEHSV